MKKRFTECVLERFNGKFRDECLNEHWFVSMSQTREIIAAWRQEYNHEIRTDHLAT